jgi:hypothetical protein
MQESRQWVTFLHAAPARRKCFGFLPDFWLSWQIFSRGLRCVKHVGYTEAEMEKGTSAWKFSSRHRDHVRKTAAACTEKRVGRANPSSGPTAIFGYCSGWRLCEKKLSYERLATAAVTRGENGSFQFSLPRLHQ